MKLMLADVEADTLASTIDGLRAQGISVEGLTLDVADSGGTEQDPDQVDSDAAKLIAETGMETAQLMDVFMAGIEQDRFYLFSHPDYWPILEERLERIRRDYAAVLPGP